MGMFRNELWVVGLVLSLVLVGYVGEALGQTAECATTSTTASDATAACGGCPCKGDCDGVGIRNQYNPSSLGNGIHMRVRVKITYFSLLQAGTIEDQRAKIIDDFRPYHILLDVTREFISDAQYQIITYPDELEAMRNLYADSPATQLNVYVAAFDVIHGKGKAVFPWESDVFTKQGGVLVQNIAIGSNKTTMTHEIGHALGLWHTSHGTELSEMSGVHGTCSSGLCSCQCYETADGANCNARGDFCCDTPPTLGNIACVDPGGQDPCSSTNWGTTDPHNFMGFAEDGATPPCRDHFTAQQAQRLHCWTCDRVSGWINSPDCNSNGTKDVCDISRGTSGDCNADGVPDECQQALLYGACCIDPWPPQVCVSTTQCACDNLYGNFAGVGTKCATINCLIIPMLVQPGDPDQ
jgi:hypothetical protein